MAAAIIFNQCYHQTSGRSLSNSFLHPNRIKFSLPRLKSTVSSSLTAVLSTAFTWDDVLQVPESSASHLHGYFQKINTCNRGSNTKHEFVPFVVEDKVVGYIHNSFADRLKKAGDAFVFNEEHNNNVSNNRGHITLNSELKTHDERTKALGEVVKFLGNEIPGIRNELFPVTSSFGSEVFFSLERAAAPFFGIKAYGIHMNGYVEKEGQKYLWIAKRSDSKPTYPGMLDHLVAGGLPHGISCGENILKECEEEAGIPSSISKQAIPVGAVSYMDINGYSYKRDVLFCYDLKLPQDFIPLNQGELDRSFKKPVLYNHDGEVGSFKLIPVPIVANVIRNTFYFKSNCNLVIIDFLVRHGYIKPEDVGYLELLQKLRSGDCS